MKKFITPFIIGLVICCSTAAAFDFYSDSPTNDTIYVSFYQDEEVIVSEPETRLEVPKYTTRRPRLFGRVFKFFGCR